MVGNVYGSIDSNRERFKHLNFLCGNFCFFFFGGAPEFNTMWPDGFEKQWTQISFLRNIFKNLPMMGSGLFKFYFRRLNAISSCHKRSSNVGPRKLAMSVFETCSSFVHTDGGWTGLRAEVVWMDLFPLVLTRQRVYNREMASMWFFNVNENIK